MTYISVMMLGSAKLSASGVIYPSYFRTCRLLGSAVARCVDRSSETESCAAVVAAGKGKEKGGRGAHKERTETVISALNRFLHFPPSPCLSSSSRGAGRVRARGRVVGTPAPSHHTPPWGGCGYYTHPQRKAPRDETRRCSPASGRPDPLPSLPSPLSPLTASTLAGPSLGPLWSEETRRPVAIKNNFLNGLWSGKGLPRKCVRRRASQQPQDA